MSIFTGEKTQDEAQKALDQNTQPNLFQSYFSPALSLKRSNIIDLSSFQSFKEFWKPPRPYLRSP